MKAVVAAFNQEKALVGAFSVIVQLHRLIDSRHYAGPRRGAGQPEQPRPLAQPAGGGAEAGGGGRGAGDTQHQPQQDIQDNRWTTSHFHFHISRIGPSIKLETEVK